jgi:hypothetical protein
MSGHISGCARIGLDAHGILSLPKVASRALEQSTVGIVEAIRFQVTDHLSEPGHRNHSAREMISFMTSLAPA